MFIYKKLKASDANTIAFEAHKEYNINKDNTASLGVSLLDSSYSSASRDTYSVFDINNHKQYFQLDHLFYKDALFNYGNLIGGIDYNNQEKRLYDKATIISLSQKTFGSGVQKGTFLFNNTYKDDSLGNLYVKNDILSNYPQDKERVFYLAPVKGFKSVDLTRDPNTGEPIVNAATSYNDLKLDDSLYINPVEYISCSFARNTTLNCTEVDLTNGYIKAPNSNNYNFSNEDFTISFYYKVNDASPKSYILAKSKTQTVVEYPESNLNGSLKNTHGSSSLLQPKEVDAGKAFPFEIFVEGRKIHFNRADQNIESTHNSGATSFTGNTLYHVACVKTGSELKIYLDGTLTGGTGTDTTDLCQNKADLFIGTDPTISSSKLDNTSNQSISQLMIWNRGLTATEVENVSESIDGSPYVGNIFYENGIATLTSPKVNDGTLTSLQDTTGIITLDNTPYDQGAGTTVVLPQPTFSGSLTFTSSRETLEQLSGSQIFDLLSFNSTYISASLTSDIISLVSNPYALVDDYIIDTIQSETFDTYDSYAELNSIVDAIPGGIGTGSGDRGTDGDSITATEEIAFIGEGVFLAENQTVTASFDIDPVSPSNIINEEWYVITGGGGGNSPINTDNLPTETEFQLRIVGINNNVGGVVSGELLTQTDGEIAVTGSNGFVSLFTDASTDGITGTGTLPSIASPSYGAGIQMIGSATGQVNVLGIGDNGVSDNTNGWAGVAASTIKTNLDSNAFPGNFTVSDAVSVTNGRFNFGPAVEDGDGGFRKFYKKPGNLRFKVSITARENGGQYTVNPVYRFNNGSAPSGAWFPLNNSFIEQADGSAGANEQSLGSTFAEKIWYINVPASQGWYNQNGDQLEFGVAFNEYQGGNVKVQQISAVLASQEESAGFKDRLALETDQQTFTAGSIIEYTFNDININSSNSNLLTRSLDSSAEGTTTNELDYNASGPDAVDSRLWVKLYGPINGNYNTDTVPVIASHDYNVTNTPGSDLTNTVQLSEAGNYFWRVYVGDNSGNALFTRAYAGFSLNEVLIRKWEPTSAYDISNYVGPGGATHNEFGTNTNTNGETFDQSVDFDDDSFIQDGSVPTSIYNFSNTTAIGFAGNILITSSLGSTASFDQGNFISGSASIDITGTKGLYKVNKVTLGNTTFPLGQNQTAIGLDQKVRIQTKKNGTLQDTKYINGNVNSQNAFEAEADKLNLGVLDNTDNVSFEFTVVDSSNNIDKVIKNQGFNIQQIELSKITSSNEVTLVNNGTFPSNLDALYFSSSHINVGDASMPFTTGQVTASIASISADGTTITLSDNLFITKSLTDALFHVSGAENGPFIISASYSLPTQVIGTNKEYQIEELSSNINANDPGIGTGFGTKINMGNASTTTPTTLQESFQDTNGTITNDITYRNDAPSGVSFNIIEFFVSGVASPLYPDGAVTASLNYTQSINTNVTMSAISGSNISSGDTFTAGEFGPFDGYESDTLGITSSHTTDPHYPNQPLYTLGKHDIDIVTRTNDGHIKVDQILFITASSKATGSSDSSSFTPGDYSFTSLNPIEATGVTSDMLGGTFEFQDLGTLQISEYRITAIDGNEITLENLDGGSNAIQTVNESNLTNTPEVTVNFSEIVANEFTIQYKNSHLIFENEFHCTVDEDEYNFSLNPTARKNKDINKGDLANFATGSNFKPYVTTVGLYNEAGELLVVGKLGQPVRMSDETDTTFVVRYDT